MQPAIVSAADHVEAILLSTEYTERDAFHLIGCFAGTEPVIAAAFAFHIRDIVQERYEEAHDEALAEAEKQGVDPEQAIMDFELDYSEILAKAYRRCFFDREHAAKYGTEVFAGNEAILTRLASWLSTMADIAESGADNVTVLRPH